MRTLCPWMKYAQSSYSCGRTILIGLVGNVADMSPRVVAMPTISAEIGRRHNVADAVTGSQS
jgi:hypothetical protein